MSHVNQTRWDEWDDFWKRILELRVNQNRSPITFGMIEPYIIDVNDFGPDVINKLVELTARDDCPFEFLDLPGCGGPYNIAISEEGYAKLTIQLHAENKGLTQKNPFVEFLEDQVAPVVRERQDRVAKVWQKVTEQPAQFAISAVCSFAAFGAAKAGVGAVLATSTALTPVAATLAAGMITSGLLGAGREYIAQRRERADIDYREVAKAGVKNSVRSGILAALTGGLLGSLAFGFDEVGLGDHAGPILDDDVGPVGPVLDTETPEVPQDIKPEFGPDDDCQPCQVPEGDGDPCDFTTIDASKAQTEQVFAMMGENVVMDGNHTDAESRLFDQYGLDESNADAFYETQVASIQGQLVGLALADPELVSKLADAGIQLDDFADGVPGPLTAQAFTIAGEHAGLDMSYDNSPCVDYDWGRTQEVMEELHGIADQQKEEGIIIHDSSYPTPAPDPGEQNTQMRPDDLINLAIGLTETAQVNPIESHSSWTTLIKASAEGDSRAI